MSYFVQKADFYNNRVMWADIINELTVNGGFKLISVNGVSVAPTIDIVAGIDSAVIEATNLVDLLSDTQPWRICVKCTSEDTQLYCATPTQIQDDGTVSIAVTLKETKGRGATAKTETINIYSGTIGNVWGGQGQGIYTFWSRGSKSFTTTVNSGDNTTTITTPATPGSFGYANAEGVLSTYNAPRVGSGTYEFVLKNFDYAAHPFSYSISCTNHGVAFASWVEGTDGYGCTQNWFVVQRAINSDGSIVTTGKAPLFCVYSVNGGGSTDANTLDTYGIMRFTVREVDINAPTIATSAVAHTKDSTAVMNSVQQVCFSENGRFDFKFPQGFNTARYSYPYQIDMIAYTSADVCSQRLDVQVQVYNEVDVNGAPVLRTYRALSANCPNNTGMRPFMLVPSV